MTLVLTTDDERLAITDGIIHIQDPINPGEVTFELFDWFEVYAFSDAQLGNITCNINITSGGEEYPYEIDNEIQISLSLLSLIHI